MVRLAFEWGSRNSEITITITCASQSMLLRVFSPIDFRVGNVRRKGDSQGPSETPALEDIQLRLQCGRIDGRRACVAVRSFNWIAV